MEQAISQVLGSRMGWHETQAVKFRLKFKRFRFVRAAAMMLAVPLVARRVNWLI